MIYSSNHLEYLCQTLAGNIGQNNNHVFGREVVITQSAGMTAWLKTGLATRNGVIANTAFMNQDTLFGEIYQLLFKTKLRNNKDVIRYKVYKELGNGVFKYEFPSVSDYYKYNDLRRIQLAGIIADLFDQYQLYRSEMIRLWEEDMLTKDPHQSERWQKWLWRNLKIESRASTRDKLIALLEKNKEQIRKAYPVISFFGITIFTDFHLAFFNELSKYTKLDFYLCLPTSQKDFKNELLVSFGKKAGELADMVEGSLGKFDYAKLENKGDTSLADIQEKVVNNMNNLDFKDDGSMQINSCYTPVREVECLYNYLLDLFEKDKAQNKEKADLKPGDILVMATDINKYAPFIKAVFRNAPVKIPFRVSGAANNSEDSIVAALEQILRFTENDLTSEKVISLLEQKRIKQRFRVSDCDYIRSVVKKANIRFGRENRIEDDSRYVSWKYGLDKILLGYAMLTDDEYKAGDDLMMFPFRDAEASESHDLFRLKAFVGRLESVMDEEGKNRTMTDWKKFLFKEVIDKMVYHDDFDKDDRTELSSVYRSLSFIDTLEFDEEVPFEVFLDELDSKLFAESGEMKLNTGDVTVSAPVPVRGIPFRVICFLGLDNEVFPRKDQLMGFDLLGEKYLPGDRDKKETDKYLFLDTILSAREKLYLSYIGQNVKDNAEIPPSIVVDTLVDYLGTESLARKHPLHGFSSQYHNPKDKSMFTYLYGSSESGYSTRELKEKEIKEVSLKSLVDFFQSPVEWYFNYILDVNYDDTEDILDETEIFELDNLQKWIIRKKLLGLKDEELKIYIEKGKKEGFLPLKTGAAVAIKNIKKEIEFIFPVYQRLINNRNEESAVIDTEVMKIRISGVIDGLYDKEFISYSVSKYPLKYKIEAYIKSLLLFEAGKIDSASFIDREGLVTRIPADAQTAKSNLEELLKFFIEGNKSPVPFTIKSAEKARELADKAAREAKKKATGKTDSKKRKEEKEDKEIILEILENEAFPEESSKIPANPYLRALFRENFFHGFGDKEIELIKMFSDKLKLFVF